jgi:hypothetical protein
MVNDASIPNRLKWLSRPYYIIRHVKSITGSKTILAQRDATTTTTTTTTGRPETDAGVRRPLSLLLLVSPESALPTRDLMPRSLRMGQA